jgi:hypothetical protein
MAGKKAAPPQSKRGLMDMLTRKKTEVEAS